MSDSLPIHLDRAMAALAAHGVRLRRSKVLELLAALLGHRSSNELVAAAERGEVDPPKAGLANSPSGLVCLVDPVTGRAFAVEHAMLEGADRASSYLLSPWGNLLDVRDARASLAGRDADVPDDAVVRSGAHGRLDLPRMVAEANLAGQEYIDVRSDGVTARITSGHPDRGDVVLYEGDSVPVDALLHRLRDDREEWEHGPHRLNVLGAGLDVEHMSRHSPDDVRLFLRTGRERNRRVMHTVWLSHMEANRIWATKWDRRFVDGANLEVEDELVRTALDVVGDGPVEVVPGLDGDGKLTSVTLRDATDATVTALRRRQGLTRQDAIRSLVVLGLGRRDMTLAERMDAQAARANRT